LGRNFYRHPLDFNGLTISKCALEGLASIGIVLDARERFSRVPAGQAAGLARYFCAARTGKVFPGSGRYEAGKSGWFLF